METLVFMDRAERVASHACNFARQNEKVEWNKSQIDMIGCYHKFIVVENTLVIGPVDYHDTLYKLYLTRDLPAEEAKKKLAEIKWSDFDLGPAVTTAGKVNNLGRVTDWDSAIFKPPFPTDELARAISSHIERLFRGGHLTPK